MTFTQGNSFTAKLLFIPFFILLFFSHSFAQRGIQTDVPAIKDVFKNDFYFGCLLSYPHVGFASDPHVPGQSNIVDQNGGYLIKYHMNSMSPGNNMKPQNIVDIGASATRYNNASAAEKEFYDVNPVIRFNGNMIAQLNWAQRQGFTFRGHTLVWHNQTPGTAFFRTGYSANGARLSKEKMTLRMENFIKETIRIIHEGWPGLLTAMDVVNEAVNDNGTDRISNNEWYETFGDISYIMKAFEFARKYTIEYGETQMKLYYNDYNTHQSAKADGIVRVCKPIYEAGYLDGIGMQDHDQYNSPTAAQWIASYNKFAEICDEISVTELDVKPSTSANSLITQANQYGQLFKCFLDRSYFSGRGKLISVSKDGLNDNWAFVKSASLWDENNQCKPAFYEVVKVGLFYNSLDSLITFAETLIESDYTPDSWNEFTTSLTGAKESMMNNYSYLVSTGDALENAFNNLDSSIKQLDDNTTSVDNFDNKLPDDFSLMQNYPNPFNPTTTIVFSLPHSTQVKLVVFDVMGKTIAELVNGNYNAGRHKVNFNANGISSGIYFYRLEAGNFSANKKLLLLK